MKSIRLTFILSFRIILFIGISLLLSILTNKSLSNLNLGILGMFLAVILFTLIFRI